MKPISSIGEQQPLELVTSCTFGRYPKISGASVYNMFESDGWMVNYSGHKKVAILSGGGDGRGNFNSTRYNKLIAVVGNGVYVIDKDMSHGRIGLLDTYSGDVYIAENDAGQIAICDKKDIYIFDYINGIFEKVPDLDFIPGYIDFQNGRFISPDLTTTTAPSWRLSASNNGFSWPASANYVGRFQTKPDIPVACVRFPGKGNLLFVMGKTVIELWTDVGYQLFPYQRSSSINIDYGCLSAATIAEGDGFIVWLGVNEKSGAVIMHSSGGQATPISTDGINYKLSQLTDPEDSYGFLFQQDGHLFYQLTFHNPADNFTLVYDFNLKKFYYLCDGNMNHHIAKRMSYFNNSYYFVSFNDGYLYESNSAYTTYDGEEIPRIITTKPIRTANSEPFIVDSLQFVIEQGMENEKSLFTPASNYRGEIASAEDFPVIGDVSKGDYYTITANSVTDNDPEKTNTMQSFSLDNEIVWNGEGKYTVIQDLKPRVDISISTNGSYSFSNYIGMTLNEEGHRKNRAIIWGLGYCNEFTPQFRFWGTSRFVVNNGFVVVRQ